MIIEFLAHLESDRGNSISTRNTRLGAPSIPFRLCRDPKCPSTRGLIAQVLAIPPKRANRPTVSYLTAGEIRALLAAPDRSIWIGCRDHALLQVATQTGLRVAELTDLRCQDAWLGTGPYVRCDGKGRKQRCTPLTTATARTLRVWLTERAGEPLEPLFCTRDGRPISRDAVERLLRQSVAIAAVSCPSLREKKVSPQRAATQRCYGPAPRRSRPIRDRALARAKTTRTVQAYLHADMSIKQRALDRTAPPGCPTGRYHPPATVITFLDGL